MTNRTPLSLSLSLSLCRQSGSRACDIYASRDFQHPPSIHRKIKSRTNESCDEIRERSRVQHTRTNNQRNVEFRTSCSSPYAPIETLTVVFSFFGSRRRDRARITRQPRRHVFIRAPERIEQLVDELVTRITLLSFLKLNLGPSRFSLFLFPTIESTPARRFRRRHAANAKSARRRDRRLHVSRLAVRLESSKARLESRASVRRNESHGERQSVKAAGIERRTLLAPSGSRRRIIIFHVENRPCVPFGRAARDISP